MIEGGEWRRMQGSRGVNVTICIICQFPRIDAMGGTWQNIVETPRTGMILFSILASGWRIYLPPGLKENRNSMKSYKCFQNTYLN